MKVTIAFLIAASAVSPIEKTVQLLTELQGKIVKDGENEQKIYEEFIEYCEDTSKDTQFAIKTGKATAERAQATIAENAATISSASSKIEELAASIATAGKDLAAATEIREKEASDFAKLDQDLAETVSMISRAVAIIEQEMSKSPSLVQADSVAKIQQALQTVLEAASVNSADKAKVQALLQTEDDDLQPAGAPDPAAYKSHSGGIVSTLEDMLDKAKAERADAQKSEMNAAFDFKMLKQKLEDSGAAQGKEMNGHKRAKSAAEEKKAGAEGELEATNADVASGAKGLKDLQHECMTRASTFEQEQHERSEELAALDKAKSLLEEKTGGAADRTYSFIQLKTKSRMHAKHAQDQVVALFQRLGKEQGAVEISMLASRIQSTMVTGDDPFAKVKGLIQQMIEQLVAEAEKEASHKAFCDKEMSETKAKRDDKQGELDDLSTKIDQADSKIAKLKEDITTLQKELTQIATTQAEADKVRAEEKEAWKSAKADFEGGLEGVGMALQVLRDYYAEKDEGDSLLQTKKETGAASGIIGLLEVIESDFSKMLADGSAGEDASQKSYDQLTQDNKVATAAKTTESKFKTGAVKETQAALAGLKQDQATAQTEIDAILEYWDKLQPMCVAKPEPYAERKRRREAEIAGLKEGLRVLNEESGSVAFLQIRRA